jgi:hypothetical protein
MELHGEGSSGQETGAKVVKTGEFKEQIFTSV